MLYFNIYIYIYTYKTYLLLLYCITIFIKFQRVQLYKVLNNVKNTYNLTMNQYLFRYNKNIVYQVLHNVTNKVTL